MLLDKTIRENLDGKYIKIYADHFKEGVEYAAEIKISQIHLIGVSDIEEFVDFKELEKLSSHLEIFSFISVTENVVNFGSIYTLNKLKKIYFQEKQKFIIDVSKFPQLQHLGGEYWKGIQNIEKTFTLNSLLLLKLPDIDLQRFSKLLNLKILHIYSSKIQSLDGIEKLPIEEVSIVRNGSLEDISIIQKLHSLKVLNIEKCKKIIDSTFLNTLQGVDIKIIS